MKTMNLRRLLPLLLLSCLSASAQLKSVGDGGPGPVKALHLTAELVSLAPSVAPGGSVEVGLVISPEEKWHVYWVNAGDSGEPPAIKWTLPAGITAAPMQFPVPSRLPLGPLMDFGYDDNTAFPVKISVAPGTKPGPIHLDAAVSWLVCREVCIPGKAHMGIDLTVQPGAAPGQLLGTLGEALKAIPPPLPASSQFSVLGGKSEFVLTFLNLPSVNQDDLEFYPIDPDLIVNAADQDFERIPNGFRVRIPRSPDLATLPATLHGVLKTDDGEGYELSAPIVPGELPGGPVPSSKTTPSPTPNSAPSSSSSTLTALPAIGLAFLGGIILNLMPCVFPVLFLKGLALVQSSGEERGKMRSHGLVYTLGILVSFWAIVAVLLILRATGSHIGWGFQLQSPTFIAILAAFLFFFALSLAGQFDLGLSMTSAGGELAQKEGYAGSFFTGVLATVVATPCTAPLMGAAIGFALAQPPLITFAVFTALALGLAAPYLLLTIQPAWTRILPRPGAWMEILKQLTAIPLFATVIWLAWVYGRLHAGSGIGTESDNLAYLLLCFLVLAIAGWVLGRWPAKWPSAIAATILVILALAIPLSHPRVIVISTTTQPTYEPTREPNLAWQPYSQTTLDAARAAGHPVFIDFTAAWCLSCQVNEKLVLRSAEVEHQLAAHNFTLLRADWTQYDPAITAQLSSLNRSGVPTYVIYPATGTADVLPELLTKDAVLTAIQTDAK
jgi:thiol:disulfide interchange protein/DsbC/DsbD-like thiol-disulfide interchange protein